MEIRELLEETVRVGASDLHLTVGAPPCVRLHGHMEKLNYPVLDQITLRAMLETIINGDQQNTFREKNDLDFSVDVRDLARFRANFFVGRRGEGAVFRVIPTKILTVDDLNLPQAVRELAHLERGLVLVTGPTGSGKSTTLAALVNMINCERNAHILTIEDPIEFVHEHRRCLVNQREVKSHTQSFASALRAALREDPDVILVGEMRDLETISLAVSAAETGHLVFGTLHTSSAAKTIDRIIDVFPPHQQAQIRTQLSESLEGVIAQSLIAKIGGGRIAALEILISTAAVRNLIREGKTFQIPSVIEVNSSIGMQTLDQALLDLIKSGSITTEDAVAKGLDPGRLAEVLGQIQSAPATSKPAPSHSVQPSAPSQPVSKRELDDDLGDLDDLKPFSRAA